MSGTEETVPLTPELLARKAWRFGPLGIDAFYAGMRFLADGRIFDYPSPNEQLWRLEGETLVLLSAEGVPTNRVGGFRRIGGAIRGTGPYLGRDDLVHRLESIDFLSGLDTRTCSLRVEATLGDGTGPLLVVFNCLVRGFTAAPVVWDYYGLTRALDVDHCRFAERPGPGLWYLDKAARIRTTLAALAAGRRHVVLAGCSSGGYAALRFGTWLAAERPDCRVETVACNPQTVHAFRHRHHLRSTVAPALLPEMIEDDLLAAFGGEADVELDRLVRPSGGNARHVVLYDSGNPAEAYQVEQVCGLPGVEARPRHLGVGHVEGIGRMELHDGLMATVAGLLAAGPGG